MDKGWGNLKIESEDEVQKKGKKGTVRSMPLSEERPIEVQ